MITTTVNCGNCGAATSVPFGSVQDYCPECHVSYPFETQQALRATSAKCPTCGARLAWRNGANFCIPCSETHPVTTRYCTATTHDWVTITADFQYCRECGETVVATDAATATLRAVSHAQREAAS